MAHKKTNIEEPKFKIVADEKHPFFNAYHKEAYIKSHDCRSTVVLSEQQMQYILYNPSKKEIVVYQIDKGLIQGSALKCDFGIYTENDILFLIELKRPEREYAHALEQIINTIELLIVTKHISVKKLNTRIVSRNYPKILTATERKLENILIRDYKCNLQHGSKTLTEALS